MRHVSRCPIAGDAHVLYTRCELVITTEASCACNVRRKTDWMSACQSLSFMMSIDATGAHSACVHRHVTTRIVRHSSHVGRSGTTATQDVRQTTAELVGQERVQQRVEAAVEVVQDEREGSDDEMPVCELRFTESLPQHTYVVRQDTDSERDDDSNQQANDFASGAQCGLVCVGGHNGDSAMSFMAAGQ